MKKIIVLPLLCVLFLSSCLKKDALDVEDFADNNINDIAGVWYRFVVKEGETEVLKMVELDGIESVVDKENRNITVKVKPSEGRLTSIPEESRNELSIENIGVVVSLPTAARIFPKGDAPKLGVNGDWSKPNSYDVMAANGQVAEWTIHLQELDI